MSSHPRPDRFEFLRVLGKGGGGEVLLTRDRERDEPVALKFVRLAEAEADLVQAERNGAQLQWELARIAPQVPRVFEEGEDSEFFYYVMEYVAGKDLSDLLRKGPLPEDRAIHIATQLLDLLIHLHSFTREIAGRKLFEVVHGDIKPDNIRLQEGDRVRVIDFGIAKQLSLTRNYTRNLFGSVPYLPPERLEHGRVDIHSDLWAVAVVLYYMVSGHLPHQGTTPEAVEQNILAHKIEPLPGTCSRSLKWIISKSLSFDVERRYPTAAAFRQDLQELRDKGSVDPAPKAPVQRSETTQPTRAPVAPPSMPTTRTPPPPPSQEAVPPPVLPPPGKPQIPLPAPPSPAPPSSPLKRPAVSVRPLRSPVAAKPAAGARKKLRELWLLLPLLGVLAAGYFLWPDGQRQPPEDPEPPVSEPAPEDNPQDRARLLYSQGQAALTEAEELTGADAEEKRAEAQAAFEEAAREDEEWPEPVIGLARVLVNGDPPVPETFEALRKEARKRGHGDSRIFSALLADAYLAAGKRLMEQAGLEGGPYEPKLLEEAHENLDGAVHSYEEAGDLDSAASRYSEAWNLRNKVAETIANL